MVERSPVSSRERVAALDVIRGWALLGVLIANLHEAIGGRLYGLAAADDAARDRAATLAIQIAVTGRSITRLTFLFGLGFAIQLMRAGRAARTAGGRSCGAGGSG